MLLLLPCLFLRPLVPPLSLIYPLFLAPPLFSSTFDDNPDFDRFSFLCDNHLMIPSPSVVSFPFKRLLTIIQRLSTTAEVLNHMPTQLHQVLQFFKSSPLPDLDNFCSLPTGHFFNGAKKGREIRVVECIEIFWWEIYVYYILLDSLIDV